MVMKLEWNWEQVHCNQRSETIRTKVIGGWLVHTVISDKNRLSSSMVFVPDTNHQWMIKQPVKEIPKEESVSEGY